MVHSERTTQTKTLMINWRTNKLKHIRNEREVLQRRPYAKMLCVDLKTPLKCLGIFSSLITYTHTANVV